MIYLWLLLISFTITVILTPILKRLAIKYGLYDNPAGDKLKIHEEAIPYFGGLAMMVGTLLALMAVSFFTQGLITELITIGFSIVIISLFGLWDDLNWKHILQARPKLKFKVLIQLGLVILITIIFVANGIKVQFFPQLALAGVLTFFYILGLTNAINLQDGLDGLAAGLVAISAIGFGILSYWNSNELGIVLALVTLGATLGFLIYNFNPASIFMGDSGSYFLGLIVVILAIIFTSKPYDFRWFIGPIMIVGLPIFDTGLTIIRRLVRGKSPFCGDRSHIYDRIHSKGVSVRKTVLICYFIQILFIASGLFILK